MKKFIWKHFGWKGLRESYPDWLAKFKQKPNRTYFYKGKHRYYKLKTSKMRMAYTNDKPTPVFSTRYYYKDRKKK